MRGLAKFLYNHNPFYVISAVFVMYGLRQLFPPSSATQTNAWFLAQSLAGYSLLLVVTACLVVRLGKVWDDARTIALLVLLLCVGVSSSFDDLALNQNAVATQVLGFGFLFSILLIEILKWGMGLRLSFLFRMPLYAVLFLFFMFPVVLGDQIWSQGETSMAWRVFLFPTLAAVGFLLLIPAARSGKELVQDNGSPWPWPLFPWSIFFILSLGVIGRAYFLTLSFQTNYGLETTFGAYYLVPFVLALLCLLAEIGFAENKKALLRGVAFAPALLLVMSCWHNGNSAYWGFLQEVTNTIGSPLFLTLHASVAYTTWLWLRGVRIAKLTTNALLITICFVGPTTLQFEGLEVRNYWPFWAMFALQLWEYLEAPSSIRLVHTSLLGLASTWFAGDFGASQAPLLYLAIFSHCLLLSCLFAVLLFEDRLAQWLRRGLPIALVGLAVVAIAYGWLEVSHIFLPTAYLAGLLVVSLCEWRLLAMRLWKWTSVAVGVMFGGLPIVRYLNSIREQLPALALETLVLGLLCFAVGGWLSALKGGMRTGSLQYFRREWDLLRYEWRPRSDGGG